MRLAALLLFATVALATSKEETEVTCPVCETVFKADRVQSTNTMGGIDRDFLEHAEGGQRFVIECWTCPACWYSGDYTRFGDDLPAPALLERLREERPLKPKRPIDAKVIAHTSQIPAWVRYDLFSQVLALDDSAPAYWRAYVELLTAQTQRFGRMLTDEQRAAMRPDWERLREQLEKRSPALPGYDFDISMARELEALAAGDKQRRGERLLHAATLYKRRGEDPDAARVLALLRAEPDLTQECRLAIEGIEERIARERKYAARALRFYELSIADSELEPRVTSRFRYLAGEICRKLGRREEALAHLEPLLADKRLPKWAFEWVRDAIRKTRGGPAKAIAPKSE